MKALHIGLLEPGEGAALLEGRVVPPIPVGQTASAAFTLMLPTVVRQGRVPWTKHQTTSFVKPKATEAGWDFLIRGSTISPQLIPPTTHSWSVRKVLDIEPK